MALVTEHLHSDPTTSRWSQAAAASEQAAKLTVPLAINSIKKIVIVASATVLLLGVLREMFVMLVGTETGLQDLRPLGLDQELSIPAFYESMMMILAATILVLIGLFTKAEGGRDHARWFLLAVVFAALAVDESASLHEVLMNPVRGALGLSGFLYYAWVVPGLIGVAALGLYLVPFLLRLPRRTAIWFVLAGALFVGGAIGFEMIGGWIDEQFGKQTLAYVAAMVTEEGLEIVGLTVFLVALVDYAKARWGNLRLTAG